MDSNKHMKNRKLKYVLYVIVTLLILVLLYFSPLNKVSVNNITADNINDLETVPFNLAVFAWDTNNSDFEYDNKQMIQDYGDLNVEYKVPKKDYYSEYEINFQDNPNYSQYINSSPQELKFDYSVYFSSEKKNVRLIGFYEKDNLYPSMVILRTYPYQWFPNKYKRFESNNIHNDYDEYFNDYANTLFNSFQEKGYSLKKTNFKNGSDILINSNLSEDFIFAVKKRNLLDSEDIGALEFNLYSNKKIRIPFLETLF